MSDEYLDENLKRLLKNAAKESHEDEMERRVQAALFKGAMRQSGKKDNPIFRLEYFWFIVAAVCLNLVMVMNQKGKDTRRQNPEEHATAARSKKDLAKTREGIYFLASAPYMLNDNHRAQKLDSFVGTPLFRDKEIPTEVLCSNVAEMFLDARGSPYLAIDVSGFNASSRDTAKRRNAVECKTHFIYAFNAKKLSWDFLLENTFNTPEYSEEKMPDGSTETMRYLINTYYFVEFEGEKPCVRFFEVTYPDPKSWVGNSKYRFRDYSLEDKKWGESKEGKDYWSKTPRAALGLIHSDKCDFFWSPLKPELFLTWRGGRIKINSNLFKFTTSAHIFDKSGDVEELWHNDCEMDLDGKEKDVVKGWLSASAFHPQKMETLYRAIYSYHDEPSKIKHASMVRVCDSKLQISTDKGKTWTDLMKDSLDSPIQRIFPVYFK